MSSTAAYELRAQNVQVCRTVVAAGHVHRAEPAPRVPLVAETVESAAHHRQPIGLQTAWTMQAMGNGAGAQGVRTATGTRQAETGQAGTGETRTGQTRQRQRCAIRNGR